MTTVEFLVGASIYDMPCPVDGQFDDVVGISRSAREGYCRKI
jgi:hypothetical protein